MRRSYLFILFFVIFIISNLNCFAQDLQEEPLVASPNKFSLGIGVGLATMYGDLNTHKTTFGERIGLGKHLTNSFMLGVEYYTGTLSSSETPNAWTTGLSSTSKFYSIDLNAKISFSVFFSNSDNFLSKVLSGFYVGSGLGYVNVTVLNITQQLKPNDTTLKKGIKMHDEQPYIPLNIGFRLPLKSFLGTKHTQLMVNYNMCYTYSDYIDGYNLSKVGNSSKANRFNDVYSVLTAGLSFSLSRNKESFRWISKHEEPKKVIETRPAIKNFSID